MELRRRNWRMMVWTLCVFLLCVPWALGAWGLGIAACLAIGLSDHWATYAGIPVGILTFTGVFALTLRLERAGWADWREESAETEA